MKEHIVQCRKCKKVFDTNGLTEGVDFMRGGKNGQCYYHMECWTVFVNPEASADINDYDFWLDEICQYLSREQKVSYNYHMISTQLKKYMSNGKTGKGCYFTVRYMFEGIHSDWSKANGGIGLVDYIYNESAAYWASRWTLVKDIVENITKQRQARMAQKVNVIKRQTAIKKKEIDINAILGEDDEDEE